MTTVIYHNPACGTSRNVLAAIRATGTEPVVIDYRNDGWTRAQLLGLFAAADITPHDALRTFKTRAAELGLPDADGDTVIAAMVDDPVLVNRPFVCTPRGVALCRPASKLLPLLEIQPDGPLLKDDGTPLLG